MSRFQKHIFICTNEREKDHPRGCCAHKNSFQLRDMFKEELKKRGLSSIVRANAAGCLDACEFGASMVIYPEGTWYGAVVKEDVPEIINEHILNGRVVERLTIKDQKYRTNSSIIPIAK